MTTGRFAGRVCLVTGSTGMAAHAAGRLAAEGASVFVVSRSEEHLSTLVGEIRAAGGRAASHVANVTDEKQVDASVSAAVAEFGRLDALYNVAGISGRKYGDGRLHEMTLEGWQTVMTANATSAFLVSRAVVRQLLSQEPRSTGERGALLLMSSVLADHPAPPHFETHAYAASKGAINALCRSLAASYAPLGIRVNAIAPALVATPMSRRAQADEEIRAYLERKQPLAGGIIDAADVTGTALYLLSDDALRVTGQVIAVDGGWGVIEESATPPLA